MKTVNLFSRLACVMLSMLSIALFTACPTMAAEPAATAANTNGLNVLIIGHSLTHSLRSLEPLAHMIGYPAHKQMLYTILGAGIEWHYTHLSEEERKLYFGPDKKWDALIMSARDAHWKGPQEISSDEVYAPKFAAEVFKNNPQCQIFIYGNWPTLAEDIEKPSYGRTEAHIERVAAAVDKAFPNAPKTRVMPCSLLIRELERMASRGELPGVFSRFDFFADGGDHLLSVGAYAIDMLAGAMLYNESPLNYPADIYWKDNQGNRINGEGNISVSEAIAAVIKPVVWDILQTYPPAGMKPSLVIANRRLEPVLVGQPYKVELKALNAAGACAWSLAKGTLPQGLSLSDQGVLAGKSPAIGNYPLTIQLIDSKSSYERPLVLSVTQDTPPLIPTQPLGTVPLDQYVMQPLKMEGGVGHITWSVSDGKLPYGLMLSSAGMLVGSSGEPGECNFTIKVEDSFPTGPRSAEKAFTWTIGPARPTTLLVKHIPWKGKNNKLLAIDGKLEESFWDLSQTIEKHGKGTPTKKASFGALWALDHHAHKQAVGSALMLAIKVLDGPTGKTPNDGVHIFLDGNHNRSVIYSGDDSHFFVPRNHPGGVIQMIRGGTNWFTDAKVLEIEGGYTMEINLNSTYFSGKGNWVPFGDRSVYGFDIAVDEGDGKEVSQLIWRGDNRDDQDTSHFGSIVLVDESASQD